jgi:hypothetical protein
VCQSVVLRDLSFCLLMMSVAHVFFVLINVILSTAFVTDTIFGLQLRGTVVVKALCYKPEGRGFETR